jgi:hypothetical protein
MFSFSFDLGFLKISISSVTLWSFKIILFNLHFFVFFCSFSCYRFLVLFHCSLIKYRKLLQFSCNYWHCYVLPKLWSVLEEISWAAEDVYSVDVRWITLWISVDLKYHLIMKFLYWLFLNLQDLFIGEYGVFKSYTIIVLGSICTYELSNVCFIKLGVLTFNTHMFIIVIPFGWAVHLY